MDESKARSALERFKEFKILASSVLGDGAHIGYCEVEKVLEEFLHVFKLAKYSLDQECILNRTPPINSRTNWGWIGHKHFLIQGSKCRVIHRHFVNAKFVYGVEFHEETYIINNEKKLPDQKAVFMIPEDWLDKD